MSASGPSGPLVITAATLTICSTISQIARTLSENYGGWYNILNINKLNEKAKINKSFNLFCG